MLFDFQKDTFVQEKPPKEPLEVRIRARPFAKGAERYAFHM
jgi:hypothetical protein